jgi:general L-amino acid transport system permease protein
MPLGIAQNSSLDSDKCPVRASGIWRLYDQRLRVLFYQAAALAALGWLGVYLYAAASEKLAERNIQTGFGFLGREAGFVISQTFIDYKPTDTFAQAIEAGIVNTVVVSAIGIVLATILGLVIGIARLSHNPLLAFLSRLYVEVVRGVPLLLYLFLLYALIIGTLPPANSAWEIVPSVFLSNRGLAIPKLHWASAYSWIAFSFGAGVLLATVIGHLIRQRRISTVSAPRSWLPVLVAVLAPTALAILFLHPELMVDLPVNGRFRVVGGAQLTPEFTALLIGLAVSTSAGIAEIVRGGITAISKGQLEAAQSLGLRRGETLGLVLIPQAIRIMLPPLTSSYLTLFKNSSLAIAIGYPDFVMVSNMTLTQTGQAIEIIVILVLVYLMVSTAIALLMNWYNRRMSAYDLCN